MQPTLRSAAPVSGRVIMKNHHTSKEDSAWNTDCPGEHMASAWDEGKGETGGGGGGGISPLHYNTAVTRSAMGAHE